MEISKDGLLLHQKLGVILGVSSVGCRGGGGQSFASKELGAGLAGSWWLVEVADEWKLPKFEALYWIFNPSSDVTPKASKEIGILQILQKKDVLSGTCGLVKIIHRFYSRHFNGWHLSAARRIASRPTHGSVSRWRALPHTIGQVWGTC